MVNHGKKTEFSSWFSLVPSGWVPHSWLNTNDSDESCGSSGILVLYHMTNDLHSNMPRMTAASVFFFGGMAEAGPIKWRSFLQTGCGAISSTICCGLLLLRSLEAMLLVLHYWYPFVTKSCRNVHLKGRDKPTSFCMSNYQLEPLGLVDNDGLRI